MHHKYDLEAHIIKEIKYGLYQHDWNQPILKGLAMIFAGQETPFIIFRSKEIYIYFKTNNKIPINLLK